VRHDEALTARAVERAVARHGRCEGSDEAQSRLGAVIGHAGGAHAGGGCDGGEAARGVAVHQVLLHGCRVGPTHHHHAALGRGHGVGRCGCNAHPAVARVRHRHAQLGGGAGAQDGPRKRHASHGQAQRAAGCRLQAAGPFQAWYRNGIWCNRWHRVGVQRGERPRHICARQSHQSEEMGQQHAGIISTQDNVGIAGCAIIVRGRAFTRAQPLLHA
jgi:hypothetical protein